MSTSVAFNVDAKVTQEWQRAIKHDKPFRSIHLQFKGETLHLINTHPSSSSYAKDFEGLREKVAEDEGCYVLLRIDDTNTWNCVSYVPEETSISTQEKMMYAVSKSPLKAKLGNGYFGEDWHVNSKKTFTFINYKNDTTPKKEASLSEAEKLLRNGLQEEETERTRQLSDPNLKGKSGLNQGAGSFDSNTQRELQKFKGGEVSFVHLGIDASEKLCLEDSKRVSTADDIRTSLAPSVPGFYLLSRSGSNVFLYCCPEKSPKNTRLVYATRMKSVRENITALGIRIAKYVEIQDPKDFESKVNDRPVNSFEREAPAPKATQSAKVVAPHPLFGSGGGAMKKKVVIPPPGAW